MNKQKFEILDKDGAKAITIHDAAALRTLNMSCQQPPIRNDSVIVALEVKLPGSTHELVTLVTGEPSVPGRMDAPTDQCEARDTYAGRPSQAKVLENLNSGLNSLHRSLAMTNFNDLDAAGIFRLAFARVVMEYEELAVRMRQETL